MEAPVLGCVECGWVVGEDPGEQGTHRHLELFSCV